MKTIQTDVSLENHRVIKLQGAVRDTDAVNFLQAEQSKSISILAPELGDNITLFFTRVAITIQFVKAIIQGSGSPSVEVSAYHAGSRISGTTIVDGQTVSSVTIGDTLATTSVNIPANSWVWLEIDALNPTVTELHLTLFYRIDA
jgi:hypothetical protein